VSVGRTRAVILPHMFGLPADLDRFIRLGSRSSRIAPNPSAPFTAPGPLGLAAASVFSFYATKVIATGEGGMVADAFRELAARVNDLKDLRPAR